MATQKNASSWEEFKKQFPKGSKVKLNSGGPSMSIKEHAEDGFNHHEEMLCQWFSGKKLESGYFAPETLVKDDGGEQHS